MTERLTRKQMSEKYPNRWLGISNIEYVDAEGKNIASAEIIYIDKSASELGILSLEGNDIEPLFTTPDETFQLGMIGGIQHDIDIQS